MASVVRPLNRGAWLLSRSARLHVTRNIATTLPFVIEQPADNISEPKVTAASSARLQQTQLGRTGLHEMPHQNTALPSEQDDFKPSEEKIVFPVQDLPRCMEMVEEYFERLELNPDDAGKLVDAGLFAELVPFVKWDNLPELQLKVIWMLAKLAGEMSTAQLQMYATSIEEDVVPVFAALLDSRKHHVLDSHKHAAACVQIVNTFSVMFELPALQDCILHGPPLKSMLGLAKQTAIDPDLRRFSRLVITLVFTILHRSNDSEIVVKILKCVSGTLGPLVDPSLAQSLEDFTSLPELAAGQVLIEVIGTVNPRILAYSLLNAIQIVDVEEQD